MDEYQTALLGTDEQVVEGYKYLNKPALKNRIKALEAMMVDIEMHKASKKATRKPRAKKVMSLDKQVKHLKYQESSKEFSITSIDPLHLPGSQHLFTFNAKYKVLGIYHASNRDGFEVKGSSLKNWDEKASFAIKLRKPSDILPIILAKSPKQIEKAITALTTKRQKLTGRINNTTLLLRVMNTK